MIKRYVLPLLLVMVASVSVNASMTMKENQKKTPMTDELFITQKNVNQVIAALAENATEQELFRIERGAKQVANLWRHEDGTAQDYEAFCTNNFIVVEI